MCSQDESKMIQYNTIRNFKIGEFASNYKVTKFFGGICRMRKSGWTSPKMALTFDTFSLMSADVRADGMFFSVKTKNWKFIDLIF